MLNRSPVVYSPQDGVDFKAAPINPDWVLVGAPRARSALLSRSPDGEATTMAWDCTAGVFRWHFACDETVHVLEGSVTVNWDGQRFTLGVGDSAYFPAGSVATWTVHSYVRKIAFLRTPPPGFVSFTLRAARRLARLARREKKRSQPQGALQPQNG